MARISKQNKIALVECLIISSPVLLLLILSILGLTIGARTGPHEGHALFFMFAFTVLVMFLISIAFYTNVAFFLISMKKIKSRANTFLYGASFTLFIAFALMIYLLVNLLEYFYVLWFVYMLSFTSLFYLYATLPEDNEKKVNMTTLVLASITIVLLLLGIATDKLDFKLTFIPLLSVLLGAYAGYYAIYRTLRLSPRLLAWAPILLAGIYVICLNIYAGHAFLISNYDWVYGIIPSIPALPAPDTILGVVVFFVIYFVSACLLSVIYNLLTNIWQKRKTSEKEVG